jgi:hypothetical protein
MHPIMHYHLAKARIADLHRHAPGSPATRAAPFVRVNLVRGWYRPDQRGSHDERG